MEKYILIFTIFIIVMLPLIIVIYRGNYDMDQIYVSQHFVDEKRNLLPIQKYKVGQTFLGAAGGLCGFDIAFAYEGRTEEKVIQVDLYDFEQKVLLVSQRIEDKRILGDVRPLKFRFEPFPDSENKNYLLEVKQIGGEEDIDILASTYDTYTKGNLYIDGKSSSGDLYIIPVYKISSFEDFLGLLAERLNYDKVGILRGKSFLIVLFLLISLSILILISFVIFGIFKRISDQDKVANC